MFFIDFRPLVFVIGIFLMVLGVMMVFPALLAIWEHGPDWRGFITSATISIGIGLACVLLTRGIDFALGARQVFLLTTLSWVVVAGFSALPLTLSQMKLSYTDAFFESISGITTTGSTVLVGIDYLPHDILLWRALLQWIGGIGIIVMAIAVLPFLRVGGMRLFKTESSDRSERPYARAAHMAKAIGVVYFSLTALCALAYAAGGMNWLEAVTHAMTTLSTGGYSTSDSSMGHFTEPVIHWTASVFMILGGLPFLQYVRMMRGDLTTLLRDQQVHGFLGFLVFVSALLVVWLWVTHDYALIDAARLVVFNVVSVVTTTGFASTDYVAWGSFAVVAFFFLTFVGACSGSTSGGIKIFRFQIAALLLRNQLRKLVHPFSVQPLVYNQQTVTDDVTRSLVAFSFFFPVSVALLTAGLALTGLDFLTCLSGAATAIANVGPGIGEIIGPAGNFATLPDSAKWLLCGGMLLGRLEIMTVLVLCVPAFWRN